MAKKRQDPSHSPVHLPQEAESIKCGPLRLSKRGVWRAGVLIAVYVAIILHIVHWKTAGRTITPVEPSEAMQTLELGYVNAGIILFVLLILSTLVFGRFFCGWGCHIVALQDLCGWVLKKLGVKPKPFRSRLLVFIPVFAAFYMFVYPTLKLRLFEGREFPGFTYHLTTEKFWATFPTPGIAIFTFFVCGFLIVWLVGNKGFCTYGCPYGAFFYYADKVAPGKIRVTDDCEQCGHCTATCTSNVRVHEEVARFGMVVDAGCMKCMDCVSVCPKGALYYGFGRTSLSVKAATPAPPRKYDFTWPEEIGMAAMFLVAMYAFRGLYDAVPLLLAIGLASVTAFLAVAIARVFYVKNVRWQRLTLRRDGAITATGFAALMIGAALLGLLLQSAVWNFQFHEGNRLYAKATSLAASNSQSATDFAAQALERFEWCAENGLFQVATVQAAIGSAHAFTGNLAEGEEHLRRAVDLGPDLANAWIQLGRTQAAQGKSEAAVETFKEALGRDPQNTEAAHQTAVALTGLGKPNEALEYFTKALALRPSDPTVLADYGLALAQAGKPAKAVEQLQNAIRNGAPPAAQFNLGLVFAELRRFDDSRTAFAKAIAADPALLAAKVALARLEVQLQDYPAARRWAEQALDQSPFEPDALALWADALQRSGEIDTEIRKLIRAKADDEVSWYRLAILYRQKGNDTAAKSLFQRLLMRNPNLPVPR
ncbi:MAG: tetratricopeptide repeat protein [Armatimonadota bacterium]|nr:tetratricopeptide repeat protein [Armatimonadota bacterium]